jgi:hypothetical protein
LLAHIKQVRASATLKANYAKWDRMIAWLEKRGERKPVEFKPSFRVGCMIKPKDPILGEPRIIKGIHPRFGYDTNEGILDFEFEDNWELVDQKPVGEADGED